MPVVLGSATPSLETFNNAAQGRYEKLSLPRRIGSAGVPQVRVVDLNRHASRQALSTPLIAAIDQHLTAGNQVLAVPESARLRARVVLPQVQGDRAMPALRCSHDGAREGRRRPLPSLRRGTPARVACRTCGSERIAVGSGTQRVGDELAALFPAARIARLDRDSTSRKGSLAAVLHDVETGNVEILIGTQMLTKGHDFPRVTLVGVLNADQGLFGTDPRSHERLAQTILQVAGRAGRADRPGEVVIQTHYPDHPLLEVPARERLRGVRDARARRAPRSRLAAVRASRGVARGSDAPRCSLRIPRARAQRRGGGEQSSVAVLGPRRCRWSARTGAIARNCCFAARNARRFIGSSTRTLLAVRNSPAARRARWSIDIDPLEV